MFHIDFLQRRGGAPDDTHVERQVQNSTEQVILLGPRAFEKGCRAFHSDGTETRPCQIGIRSGAPTQHLDFPPVLVQAGSDLLLEHDLAISNHDQPVTGPLDVRKYVAAEKDGCAVRLFLLDDVGHQLASLRIQSRGRLVQQEQFGPVEQGLRQSQPLDHPLGEAPDFPVHGVAQAQSFELVYDGFGKVLARLTRESAVKLHGAPGGVERVGVKDLRLESDSPPSLPATGLEAEDRDAALVRFEEPQDGIDGGGLACSVGTDEGGDRAPRHGHVHAPEGMDRQPPQPGTEGFRHSADLDDRVVHGSAASSGEDVVSRRASIWYFRNLSRPSMTRSTLPSEFT